MILFFLNLQRAANVDNHRLPGRAGSLHKPLSCKCHSVSDYDLCQLSSSLRREGHGPVVYRRQTLTCTHTFSPSCICFTAHKCASTHAHSLTHTFVHYQDKAVMKRVFTVCTGHKTSLEVHFYWLISISCLQYAFQ